MKIPNEMTVHQDVVKYLSSLKSGDSKHKIEQAVRKYTGSHSNVTLLNAMAGLERWRLGVVFQLTDRLLGELSDVDVFRLVRKYSGPMETRRYRGRYRYLCKKHGIDTKIEGVTGYDKNSYNRMRSYVDKKFKSGRLSKLMDLTRMVDQLIAGEKDKNTVNALRFVHERMAEILQGPEDKKKSK